MGMSADALLVFGVDLGEEQPFKDPDGDTELGAYIAAKKGFKDPYSELPDEVNHGSSAQYEEWKRNHPNFEKRAGSWLKRLRDIEAEAPIELVYYCSYDYPMYVLALKGKEKRAWQGAAVGISPAELTQFDVDAVGNAAEYCRAYDLPKFENPQWLLCSMYG